MRNPLEPHSIYVVRAASGPVKVGIASNIAQRLVALQNGCFEILTIHRVFGIPEGKAFAKRVEDDALARMVHDRLIGEWVSLPVERVVREVEGALSRARSERNRPISPDLIASLSQMPLRGGMLSEARKAVGWSLQEMASRTNIPVQAIRRYEDAGDAEIPIRKLEAAQAIVGAFKGVGLIVNITCKAGPNRETTEKPNRQAPCLIASVDESQGARPTSKTTPPLLRLVA